MEDPAWAAGRAVRAVRVGAAAALAVTVILLVALWGRAVALAAEGGGTATARAGAVAVPGQPVAAPGGSDPTGLDPAGPGWVTPAAAGGPERSAELAAAAELARRLLADAPVAWVVVPSTPGTGPLGPAGRPRTGPGGPDSPGEQGPKGSRQVAPEPWAVRPRYPRIEVVTAGEEGDGQPPGGRDLELTGVMSPAALAMPARVINPAASGPPAGPSPDMILGSERAKAHPVVTYPPPMTQPFPRKCFGDDCEDPDNWHEFYERLWRKRPDGSWEAHYFTWQSLVFTVLSGVFGTYGNYLREGPAYALGNLPGVLARDFFGQMAVGRPTREDPYDNFMWNLAIFSSLVLVIEGVTWGGTKLLQPDLFFQRLLDRWQARFVSPPATEAGRRTLSAARYLLAAGGRLDQTLATLRAGSPSPTLQRAITWLQRQMVSPERLNQVLTALETRLAGPPTLWVRRGIEFLTAMRGTQLHSGITPVIIAINAGAQIGVNLLRPALPLPDPIAVDDDGQAYFATNLEYLANKLYDAFAVALVTFLASIPVVRTVTGLAAKTRIAFIIGAATFGYRLFSDLTTDRHSLAEFDRIRYRPEPDVYELMLSDVLNNATWVAYTPWWLLWYAAPSAVYRALSPSLQWERFWALVEAQSAARKHGTPVWQAEQQEREKELHWVLSKEAWDKDPRANRDQADKAWRDLVQLPTPESATENLIHLAANGADMAGHVAALAGQYIAKVVDFNDYDELADFQILDLKDRVGADKDRILDDSAALWRKLKLAVTGTREAEGGTRATDTHVDKATGSPEPVDDGGRQAGTEGPAPAPAAPAGEPRNEGADDDKQSIQIVGGVETTVGGKPVFWYFDGRIVPLEASDDKGAASGGSPAAVPEQDLPADRPAEEQSAGQAIVEPPAGARVAPPPPSGADPAPDTGGASRADAGSSSGEAPDAAAVHPPGDVEAGDGAPAASSLA
ncbi:MAG TPA: hypothetical protein VKG45_06205 [Actinomycetes bacterium]|nr:hypothetical protein [Actinomycetes bacterium]